MTPSFGPPKLEAGYIERRGEFEWFDRTFGHRNPQFTSHLVTGPPGIGKTTFITHLVQMAGLWRKCVWTDMGKNSQNEHLTNSLAKQILIDSHRIRGQEESDLMVVLDGAEAFSNERLIPILKRLPTFKRIQTVIVTSRTKPPIDFTSVFELPPFSLEESVVALDRLVEGEIAPELREQMAVRSGGSPLFLKLMAGAVNHGGLRALQAFWNAPVYDIADVAPEGKLVEIAKPKLISISEELIEALRKEPESIYKLSPRKFEELLADLLASLDIEVELTPAIKDGGRDIIARMNTPLGKVLCLVEAKKYGKDRKVGVELVRQLYGTLYDHPATCAMLVTTSSFTRGAKDFQQRHEYDLSIKDYSHVVGWIQGYKQTAGGLILPEGLQ